MFHTGLPGNPVWRDKGARPLSEAARLAHELAAREGLPIAATLSGDAERWHAETIVKTVPVNGLKQGRRERIPPGAEIAYQAGARNFSAGPWQELSVEREDFLAYMTWLRSVW